MTISDEGVVRPAGFEPATPGLGILCSILLSYGRGGEECSLRGVPGCYSTGPRDGSTEIPR